MSKDNSEKIEKLKLTTPRRHVKKYISPFQHRKASGLTLMNNGRSSYNKNYKVNKRPLSNGQYRQLARERQIDNIHHDSSQTLKWMGSFISRAKNVLKTLREEDLQLQEQLYENSRRKELRSMHIQSILDKNIDNYESKSTTASSDVKETIETSADISNDMNELENEINISANDNALVILTDSEPEEDQIIDEDQLDIEEEEQHAATDESQPVEKEEDVDIFGEESEYNSDLSANETPELTNSIEEANELLSSNESIIYEDEEAAVQLDSQAYVSPKEAQEDSYVEHKTSEEGQPSEEEDNISIVDSNNSDMSREEGEGYYNEEDEEKEYSDEDEPTSQQYQINININDNAMQYPMMSQETVNNNDHFLQSDIQKIAHQAIFGNSHGQDHLGYNSQTGDNGISNEEILHGSAQFSYSEGNHDTSSANYEDDYDENVSQSDNRTNISDEDIEEEPEVIYQVHHDEEISNVSGKNKDTEKKHDDGDESIEIDVESENESKEGTSMSDEYHYDSDSNQLNNEITEVSNEIPHGGQLSGGVHSIADIISSIPHNIVLHYDNPSIPLESNERETNTEENIDGSINIGEDRVVDNLPLYSDKIYHEVHEEHPEDHLEEDDDQQGYSNVLLNNISNAEQESQSFNPVVKQVVGERKGTNGNNTLGKAETSNQTQDIFSKNTLEHFDVENDEIMESTHEQNEQKEASPVSVARTHTHASFVNDDTSMYFTVDEGNTSLLDTHVGPVVEDHPTNTEEKYKIEISESIYDLSDVNQRSVLGENDLKYSSPFGSDPFSVRNNVSDVKSLIKETLRSITETEGTAQTHVSQMKDDIQVKTSIETCVIKDNGDIASKDEVNNTDVNELPLTQYNKLEVDNLNEGHFQNFTYIPHEKDDSQVVENAIPQDENVLVSSLSDKEEETHGISPQKDMLILLADVAQNETAEKKRLANDSKAKLEAHSQLISVENSKGVIQESDEGDNAAHSVTSRNVISEQIEYDRSSDINIEEDEIDDTSSDADDEMITALQDEEENYDISHSEHNLEILPGEGQAMSLSPEHLNSPAFHILGEAVHATNILEAQIEYPTPMESAASSDIRNEPAPLEDNNDEEIPTADNGIISEEPIEERESFTSLMFEDESSSGNKEGGDDIDVEMLDSSDVDLGEELHEQKKQNIVQKIFRAPLNTIKYIAGNFHRITNVTGNFVDELNAYPSESDANGSNNEGSSQNTGDSDSMGGDDINGYSSGELDPKLLITYGSVLDVKDDSLQIVNPDNTHNRDAYEDVEILDDTVSAIPEMLYQLNKQDTSNKNGTPIADFTETSEKNTSPQLSHKELTIHSFEHSEGIDNAAISTDVISNDNGGTQSSMDLDSNPPSDVELKNRIQILEKETKDELIQNNQDSVIKPSSGFENTYSNDLKQSINIHRSNVDNNKELGDLNPGRSVIGDGTSVEGPFGNPIDNTTTDEIENENINTSHSTEESTAHEELTNTDLRINQISDEDTAHENTANEGHVSNAEDEDMEQAFVINPNVTDDSTANEDNVNEINPNHNLEQGNNQEMERENTTSHVTTLPTSYLESDMANSNQEQSAIVSTAEMSALSDVSGDDSKYYGTRNVRITLSSHSNDEECKSDNSQYKLEKEPEVDMDDFAINNQQEKRLNFSAPLANEEELTKNNDEISNNHISTDDLEVMRDVKEQNVTDASDTLPKERSLMDINVIHLDDNENQVQSLPENVSNILEIQNGDTDHSNNDVDDNDMQDKPTKEENHESKELDNILAPSIGNYLMHRTEELDNSIDKKENERSINIDVETNQPDKLEKNENEEVDVQVYEQVDEENVEETKTKLPQESETGQIGAQKDIHDDKVNHEREGEHSLTTEDSKEDKPSKKKNKRRTRNFRKRKRAITDNSSSEGPFKRTRRGVLEKKNVFERRTRSSKK
ncbi:similar to Saccharomyces cerevisiae YMR219W ESC1 Protein localized to the nuclear periphery, involved in telomeric silencing [Maudiozyma barnettii]|uniref:Similar to Saccharomyces cerevisiae YMR219W ESC1 Protein localized to the nuclear periphery, involved in telomeric silencing n=1 Tax=Maudiozyma barnettii TaxID=61262 RepID=A0A8H2ZFT2_9SACH|nr:Esc1p [Kazachstania barnettii]CAB4252685.1 similar to Saccharomyces cerevisiae YMR219W ESC1 Protein localized to the nuclear periphery, involved in telomeric silencing [Kazachstania barnettii]CAD1780475.1 similar to Saccharomyces cerevisiae YMR219W ESC1 Protein localized to the nuclear periphery, involved in telomeric silencing [Kazachstania barnettii]